MTEPARSRAVFSTEDFSLLKTAVAEHLQKVKDTPDSVKFANLYHRLGRLRSLPLPVTGPRRRRLSAAGFCRLCAFAQTGRRLS